MGCSVRRFLEWKNLFTVILLPLVLLPLPLLGQTPVSSHFIILQLCEFMISLSYADSVRAQQTTLNTTWHSDLVYSNIDSELWNVISFLIIISL